MLIHGEKAPKGLDAFAEEIYKAVAMLKIVSWDAIRRERFFLTPKGLYDELVCNAQMNLGRRDDEAVRRRRRLMELEENQTIPSPDMGSSSTLLGTRRKDKYGLNLDEFKNIPIPPRKPNNYQRAVHMASEVHLDEMRMLLDIH